MGTRARINVIENNRILVSIYRQFDGYPTGLGQEVADFAKELKIVNGLSSNDDTPKANGMGCLAAQLVKYLKQCEGNVYIRDTGTDSQGEEYIYNLSDLDGQAHMIVRSGHVTFFGAPGDQESEMEALWTGLCSDFNAETIEE